MLVLLRERMVFLLLISLFALTFAVPAQPGSTPLQRDGSLPLLNGRILDVLYFYGQGCPHCTKVAPFLEEMNQKYPLNLHKFDIYSNHTCISIFNSYAAKYNLSDSEIGIPAVFVSETCLIGDSSIIGGFENAVSKELLDQSNTQAVDAGSASVATTDSSTCGSETHADQLSLFAITAAALVDSINPCAFGVLIFLVGARIFVAEQRKRALRLGLSFCLAVFITYLMFGLGLLSILNLAGFSGTFSVLVGLAALLIGVLYLKDAFWGRKGGFALEVPNSLKPSLMRMLKTVENPVGAFVLGFLAAAFELPCSGGPYLCILGRLANNVTRFQTIPMLVYYNLIYVLPLAAICVLLYSSFLSAGRLREWNERNKSLMKFFGGVLMLALGSSTVTQFPSVAMGVQWFLASYRIVGGPILGLYVILYTCAHLLGPSSTLFAALSFIARPMSISEIKKIISKRMFSKRTLNHLLAQATKAVLCLGLISMLVFPSALPKALTVSVSAAPERTSSLQTGSAGSDFSCGTSGQSRQNEATEIPKSDMPEVHVFIMSYCPYGLQFLKAYIPVVELLGLRANFEINFVPYTMHGEKEAEENTRILCVQRQAKERFASYLRCYVEGGDPEKCLVSAGVNKGLIDACMVEIDQKYGLAEALHKNGTIYPEYGVDANYSRIYQVKGSPTLVINGRQISVSRSAEGVKEAVCSAFNIPPTECDQRSNAAIEQTGFGPIGFFPVSVFATLVEPQLTPGLVINSKYLDGCPVGHGRVYIYYYGMGSGEACTGYTDINGQYTCTNAEIEGNGYSCSEGNHRFWYKIEKPDGTEIDTGAVDAINCAGSKSTTGYYDCSYEGKQCVDGYCCNSACTGTCEACDLAQKGTCAPIGSNQDPDNECADSECAEGVCNGAGACQTFFYDTSTICNPSFKCSDSAGGDDKYDGYDYRTPSQGYCDGLGHCDWGITGGTACTLEEGTAEEGTSKTICVDGQTACVNTCVDGLDNDWNGCIDSSDSACGGVETSCVDGIDNDCDGAVDAQDSDCQAPEVIILSPQNLTYTNSSVPLTFTVYDYSPISWIGYSLDNQSNMTITGNTIITVEDGTHRIVLYANDTFGNMASSETVCFSVNSTLHEPWETSFIGLGGYPIVDFAVYDGKLYAAADNTLYVYDGNSWNIINTPTFVVSLEPYQDKLVVGGQGGLYSFDGAAFNLVFTVPTYIKVLGVYNNTLHAGTILDKPPTLYYCNGLVDNPADWHVETDFSAVLSFSGAFGSIDSFAVYGDVMYLGSGGKLYSFNGASWSIAASYDDVYAFLDMQVYNGKLYLATRDQGWRKPMYLGGSGFSGRAIEFDGENWITAFDHDYWIYSLEEYDGKLYAGTANKILTYNGTSWETSFNATEGAYYAISMINYDGKIYAGMGNGYVFVDPVPPKTNPETVTVPEFPVATVLTVFMALTMLAAALTKKNPIKRLD